MPFSPSDISGLQFWLRADDLDASLNDGDPVDTWEDRQNNHDFTGSGSTRPLFKTNIAGSMPGVLFDGTNDVLNGGDLQSLFPSAATLFIVYQPLTTDNFYVLARNNSTDTWYRHSTGAYLGIFRTSRVSGYPPDADVPTSGRHSYGVKSSASTYQAFIDGHIFSAQTAGYADGETYFYLGGSPSDPQGESRWLDGYLFEVIAYDSAISSGDIASLEAYAEALWSYAPAGTAQPNIVQGTGSVPAPTAFAASTALPATVAGTGTVPAPSVSSDTGNPATVAAVGTIPAPSAQGTSSTSPSTVAGTGTVPAATATGQNTATPSVVAAVGTVPAPSVYSLQNGLATPATVRGVAHIYTPHFPSTVDPGGGSGGSGGGGTSEVSVLWTIYVGAVDG